MINVNNLKPGITFKDSENIYVVLETSHSKQGRGQANVKAKVKNLRNGSITILSFTGGNKVEKAHIETKEMDYLYSSGDQAFLMDKETFEQIELPLKNIAWEMNFLNEGDSVKIRKFNDEILDLELESNVTLKVKEAPDAVKGNTANNPQKKIVLETGLEIEAPMFIKEGEKVVVSTLNGKYVGRGKNE